MKDDTCFSGIRASAHPELVEGPNDRPLILSLSKDGGGYLEQGTRGLIPAHGFIPVPAVGGDPREIAAPCETNLTDGERAAMREMVRRVESRATERS